MASHQYYRPPLAAYQTKIIDSVARYTVTEASTKVGKTVSHIVWLFEQSLDSQFPSKAHFWWVAPVYQQARIAFERLKNYAPNNFFIANETHLSLTTPRGTVIEFKSAEKPDNLYGEDVYAAVFDEFTRAKETAWFALRSTLTATKGKCKLIGNVKGKGNWGYKIAQKAKHQEPGYEYYKITAYDAVDANILDIAEIEQAKRDLPEAVFKELYLAEPSEDGSNPFGLPFIRQCVQPIQPGPAICFGIDLAKSVDWTVITGLNSKGMVCHFDRFQSDWGQTKERIKLLPRVTTSIDSTGVGDPVVEELQRHNRLIESFKFTSSSKQQLMEGLAVDIQQGLTSVLPGVMQDEMECFEFSYSATGVRYTAPPGYHDDTVCSLALARRAFKKPRSGLRTTTN